MPADNNPPVSKPGARMRGWCTVCKVCPSARLSSWRPSSRSNNAYIHSMKRASVILIGVFLIMNIPSAPGEVSYRTVRVADLDIFYREAGPKDGPTILLLHGLPSSSRMYQRLLESDLASQYRLIAPDYPGFGHSSWPDHKSFAYTFDHLAKIIEDLTEQLQLDRYTLFMQDYGGPVGFRMALAHPERVQAMIIQNAGLARRGPISSLGGSAVILARQGGSRGRGAKQPVVP